MPKRQKLLKNILSKSDSTLSKLHHIAKHKQVNKEDRKVCLSLIGWHIKNGNLTASQWRYAESIINKSLSDSKIKKPLNQYLYGISDGVMIKLGMSNNIKKRIGVLQVGNPKKLSVIWSLKTGKSSGMTRLLEERLHKECKLYKIRGEWFDIGCMHIVRDFKL